MILLLDTSKEFRGGQQQVCYLAEGLHARGVAAALAVRPGSPLEKRTAAIGLPTRHVSPLIEGSPLAAWTLAREADRLGVRLINAQASHDHALAALTARFMKTRPVVLVTRRVDFTPGSSPWHRWKYRRGADAYIAISRAIRDVLVGSGVPEERIRVIHSAVPERVRVVDARASLLAELRLSDDSLLVGNVAGLVDHKGHRYLLDALPALIAARPNLHVLIAGDGPLRSALVEQTARLAVSAHVHFLGWRGDVDRLLSAFDLFVMTSHMEGLCTSILDAMSLGVPVVATAAGGIPEIVRDGDTGWLADNRDPVSIATRVLDALAEREESARRADAAHRMVREEFGLSRMIDKTLEFYDDQLNA